MADTKRLVFVLFVVVVILTFCVKWTYYIKDGNLTKAVGNLRLLKQKEKNVDQDGFCASTTNVYWDLKFEDANNTEWPWNRSQKAYCPNYYYNTNPLPRRKVTLDCSSGSPNLIITTTISPEDIQVVNSSDKCLSAYINSCCNDPGMAVPNVIHYIWYSNNDMNMFTLTSLVGVLRFARPCLILFHGPYIPRGIYWNFFISVYPYVLVVNETKPTEVFGHKLKFPEHGSDTLCINILREHGGIYLDWDEVIVRPIDHLRKFNFTMSLEEPDKLGNQFIMAAPNATFLTHYYNSYRNYNGAWAHNSIVVPFRLSKQYPHLINRLPYIVLKPPNQRQGRCVYENGDWSKNLALHSYLRWFKRRDQLNMVTIRYENTTLGAFIRFVLLGKKNICEN